MVEWNMMLQAVPMQTHYTVWSTVWLLWINLTVYPQQPKEGGRGFLLLLLFSFFIKTLSLKRKYKCLLKG